MWLSPEEVWAQFPNRYEAAVMIAKTARKIAERRQEILERTRQMILEKEISVVFTPVPQPKAILQAIELFRQGKLRFHYPRPGAPTSTPQAETTAREDTA